MGILGGRLFYPQCGGNRHLQQFGILSTKLTKCNISEHHNHQDPLSML